LHVDHVIAVASGGTNHTTNLVTACVDCNGGKGARPLSDTDRLDKQRKAVELQADRVEQIKMLAAWHVEPANADELIVDEFVNYLIPKFGNRCRPNDNGRSKLAKWVKQFDAKVPFEAIDASAQTYLKSDAQGISSESWEKAFEMIPRIAYNVKHGNTSAKELAYIAAICRNRFSYMNNRAFYIIMNDAISLNINLEGAKELAKNCTSWSQFRDAIEEFIAQKNKEAEPATTG
jgi:HNH endonuclease